MDGETLWIKDSQLIGIRMWHRCYQQYFCMDDDIIELGLVLSVEFRASKQYRYLLIFNEQYIE